MLSGLFNSTSKYIMVGVYHGVLTKRSSYQHYNPTNESHHNLHAVCQYTGHYTVFTVLPFVEVCTSTLTRSTHMNWMRTVKSPKEVKAKLDSGYCDYCEHVEADSSLAVAVFTETDSFGPVDWYAVCQSCLEVVEQEAAEEERACHQCRSVKKMSELTSWKCYDFYAAQGDTPMLLCNECRNSDTHRRRIEADQEAYDDEMEYLRR